MSILLYFFMTEPIAFGYKGQVAATSRISTGPLVHGVEELRQVPGLAGPLLFDTLLE